MLRNPIENYLNRTPDLKENANFNRSASGMESYIADETIRAYALEKLYPSWVSKLHFGGELHVHNLTKAFLPYCFGADLLLLLSKGLLSDRTISRPAKHLDTAVDHMINFLGMNQQEWAGAQAFSHVNTLLAPLAIGLSYKRIKQNMQRLIYNSNIPSRSGYQTVFSNVIFDLKTPKIYQDQYVIIGDKVTGDLYADFEEEADAIHRAFWEVLTEGDAVGNVFTFPIPTENITKDVDWNSDVMNLIIKNTVLRGQSYFFNYWGTGIDTNTVHAMCCRLNLDLSQLPPAGGRWAYEGGTGSIGVVTLNMARIGYLGRKHGDLFARIEHYMNQAKNILLLKEKIITRSKDVERLMPLGIYYDIDFDRFFRTIGMVGFDEMFLNYNGAGVVENVPLADEILNYMRELTREFQQDTGRMFNLEMTPAEGCSWRLAKLDKKMYPDMIVSGNKDGYYHSAMIPPSNKNIPLDLGISVADSLLGKFSGGTVFRVFSGEKEPDMGSMKKFIRSMAKNTKIPYFDVANTYAKCLSCGTQHRGAKYTCPDCGGQTEIFSRVVGYYRPHTVYNAGKMNEFKERIYYDF